MEHGEKFCLRWNEFESNLGNALRDLRDNRDFFDLTLACDDAQEIQVHRVILSACSTFFRNILRRLPHHHPLIYLRGIKLTDLQSLVNFIYHGEVNIAQEDLNSFLMLAEDLKIKGLTQATQTTHRMTATTSKPSPTSSCPPLRPAPVLRKSPSLSMSSSRHPPPPGPVVTNNMGPVSIKTEVPATGDEDTAEADIPASDQVTSFRLSPDTDLDTSSSDHNEFSLGVPPLTIGITEGNKGDFFMIHHLRTKVNFLDISVEVLIKEESIESLNPDDELEMQGEMYKCRLCYKSLDCIDTAENHILTHFALPGGLTCLQCGLSFNSKVLFGVHMSSEHRNIKKW